MKILNNIKKHFIIISLLFFAMGHSHIGAEENNRPTKADLYDSNYLEMRKQLFIKRNGDIKIDSIIITGLKHTRRIVILNELGIKAGDSISLFDPGETVNNLKSKGIFSHINITYILGDNGTAVIALHLREKITLIPIPMYSNNGHSQTFGFFLMESNFLGLNKRLFLGGMYSNLSKSFMIGYTDNSFLNSKFNYNFFGRYSDSEYETGDQEEIIYQKYKASDKFFSLGLGYHFSPILNIKILNGYRMSEVDASYEDNLNIPISGKEIFSGTEIKVNRMRYNEFLNFGIKSRIRIIEHFTLNSSGNEEFEMENKYATAIITAEYSHKIFHSNKLKLFLRAAMGSRPMIFKERPGGSEGFQTLPGDIIASDQYAGSKLSYEMPIMKFSWGFATAIAFWEEGVFNNIDDESVLYYGPGTGFRIYLKRVAIPALGVNYARNLRTGLNQVSVSIGFGF